MRTANYTDLRANLKGYIDSVNGVKAIYDSDKAKHDRELKDMQGKYTDEYIKEAMEDIDTILAQDPEDESAILLRGKIEEATGKLHKCRRENRSGTEKYRKAVCDPVKFGKTLCAGDNKTCVGDGKKISDNGCAGQL